VLSRNVIASLVARRYAITFTYAVLTIDRDRLIVRVEGMPALDYPALTDPAAIATYNGQEPRPVIRFQVLAQ
jgi:hypothetical protein